MGSAKAGPSSSPDLSVPLATVVKMSTEQDPTAARAEIADLRSQLNDTEQEMLRTAQRQVTVFSEELLACAVIVAGMDGTERSELEVALDAVRDKAQAVGLLQHRPPRAANPLVRPVS